MVKVRRVRVLKLNDRVETPEWGPKTALYHQTDGCVSRIKVTQVRKRLPRRALAYCESCGQTTPVVRNRCVLCGQSGKTIRFRRFPPVLDRGYGGMR